MKSKIRQLLGMSVVRYVIVGGVSYILEIGFIYSLISMGFNQIHAVAIGFWVGFVIAFILQKMFAFKNKANKAKHLARQTIFYAILVALNYTCTIVFVTLLSPVMGLFFSRTMILIITTGWNFIVYKKIIFRNVT